MLYEVLGALPLLIWISSSDSHLPVAVLATEVPMPVSVSEESCIPLIFVGFQASQAPALPTASTTLVRPPGALLTIKINTLRVLAPPLLLAERSVGKFLELFSI